MPSREQRFIVTCEHGGNRIPPRYTTLFTAYHAALNSHRGWDPGALVLARRLATTLDAALVVSQTSRLLIDLNRSEHHRDLFSTVTRALPQQLRDRILDEHYRPHRAAVEAAADAAIDAGARVVHVAAHSFTPVLDGQTRRVDIGLLYDSRRAREAKWCDRWIAALSVALPDLEIRRNYPYRGDADGLTTELRRIYRVADYLGIEVELNQRLVAQPSRFRRVAQAICSTLADLSVEG